MALTPRTPEHVERIARSLVDEPIAKSTPATSELRGEVTQIEERTSGGVFSVAMMALGGIVMLIAAIVGVDAPTLTALGVIWTAWNVLWGVMVILEQKRTYIVTREMSDDAQ
jgi:hypothetical protein